MTRCEFFTEDDRITGFSVSGHSGYSEAGSDIVCAAIIHLQNFDIIRIFVPQTAQCQHHAREHGLNGLLVLARCGKVQGDTGLVFVHPAFRVFTQHIVDGALGKLHGCGDRCADNVRARLGITAVARTAKSGDPAVLIVEFYPGHLTERSSRSAPWCTAVCGPEGTWSPSWRGT